MRYVPVRFTPITWFHISSVDSCVCAARRIPAAFTSTSRPPSCSTIVGDGRGHRALVGDVEPARGEVLGDAVGSRPSSGCARVRRRATSTACTVPASARRRKTVAWPMPDAPPVTMIRRSWNRSMLPATYSLDVVAPDRSVAGAKELARVLDEPVRMLECRRTRAVWCRRRSPVRATHRRCIPGACGARTGRTGTSGTRSPT